MDWDALHNGLKAWFASVSGVDPNNVAWAGEVVGMHGYPFATLQLMAQGAEPGTDEVRFTDQGADTDLAVEVVGNRRLTLSVRAYSRDQRPAYRAYALLERVRGRLYAPSTQDAFSAVGLGLRESAALVDVSRVYDGRQESVAALDLAFNWVSSESDTHMGTIESVIVGGTVDAPEEITVPDQTLPQESSP